MRGTAQTKRVGAFSKDPNKKESTRDPEMRSGMRGIRVRTVRLVGVVPDSLAGE